MFELQNKDNDVSNFCNVHSIDKQIKNAHKIKQNLIRKEKRAPVLIISVSSVVEFPGAGLGRLITINSELNGATQTSEAATEAGQASVSFIT